MAGILEGCCETYLNIKILLSCLFTVSLQFKLLISTLLLSLFF